MDNYEQLIEAFEKSTTMVISTCCGVDDFDFRRSDGPLGCADGDLIGVMGMAGQTGLTTTISFPYDLAVKVVALMSGANESELAAAEVTDGITEFLNMICGNAKALLNREGYDLSLSVPTVIRAREYQIGYHHDVKTAGICLKLLGETVHLRLCLGRAPVPDNISPAVG